jgi:membrane fusion protein, multidrug efflux system
MTKRMIMMLAAVAVFIAALGAVKYRQIQGAMAQGASFKPPPTAVTTTVARQEEWPATVTGIATVTAVQGVTVSADLPGIVEKISFDSGRTVRAGEVLVELDTSQERAQLAAAQSQRDLARLSLERMRGLRESGVISQADYDRAAAESSQGEARVGEIRATIERKTIRAPFSGLLGIRKVNLGQYLAPGDPVVPLQSLRPVYVNFAVPQREVGQLRPGAAVRLTGEGQGGGTAAEAAGAAGTDGSGVTVGEEAKGGAPPEIPAGARGRITAVDSIVDPTTRNVQVQATFDNADGLLRPGMFVKVQVLTGGGTQVVALPASSISYAPYGDSVFIVEDVKGPDGKSYRGVRQQFVKLGPARGDQVAVVSGIRGGEEVVTSGVFKLRNGAAVEVNNRIQPSNSPAPRPEDS